MYRCDLAPRRFRVAVRGPGSTAKTHGPRMDPRMSDSAPASPVTAWRAGQVQTGKSLCVEVWATVVASLINARAAAGHVLPETGTYRLRWLVLHVVGLRAARPAGGACDGVSPCAARTLQPVHAMFGMAAATQSLLRPQARAPRLRACTLHMQGAASLAPIAPASPRPLGPAITSSDDRRLLLTSKPAWSPWFRPRPRPCHSDPNSRPSLCPALVPAVTFAFA